MATTIKETPELKLPTKKQYSIDIILKTDNEFTIKLIETNYINNTIHKYAGVLTNQIGIRCNLLSDYLEVIKMVENDKRIVSYNIHIIKDAEQIDGNYFTSVQTIEVEFLIPEKHI